MKVNISVYFVYLLLQIARSLGNVVKLFSSTHFNGPSLNLTMSNNASEQCINLPYNWLHNVSSVNTAELCVELFSGTGCKSQKIMLYPGNDHFDLSHWRFNKKTRAVKRCKEHIDYTLKDKINTIIFNKDSITSDTDVSQLSVNIIDCKNMPKNYNIRTIDEQSTCFRYFQNKNCEGQILNFTRNIFGQIRSRSGFDSIVSIRRCTDEERRTKSTHVTTIRPSLNSTTTHPINYTTTTLSNHVPNTTTDSSHFSTTTTVPSHFPTTTTVSSHFPSTTTQSTHAVTTTSKIPTTTTIIPTTTTFIPTTTTSVPTTTTFIPTTTTLVPTPTKFIPTTTTFIPTTTTFTLKTSTAHEIATLPSVTRENNGEKYKGKDSLPTIEIVYCVGVVVILIAIVSGLVTVIWKYKKRYSDTTWSFSMRKKPETNEDDFFVESSNNQLFARCS